MDGVPQRYLYHFDDGRSGDANRLLIVLVFGQCRFAANDSISCCCSVYRLYDCEWYCEAIIQVRTIEGANVDAQKFESSVRFVPT